VIGGDNWPIGPQPSATPHGVAAEHRPIRRFAPVRDQPPHSNALRAAAHPAILLPLSLL